jgi:hypothetical protein
MAGEAKLAKHGVKETTPLAVVGFDEIEMDWNMIANVDRLKNSKGSRLRRIVEGIGGAGFRRGGICRRVCHGRERWRKQGSRI